MLLQNLRIGARLALGFGSILVLLVVVAVLSEIGLQRLEDDLRGMYEDRAIPVEELGEVNKLLLRNRVLVMDMMSFPDAANVAKGDEELRENMQRVGQVWGAFVKHPMDPALREKADRVTELRQAYAQKGLLPMAAAMRAQKPDEARKVYQEVLAPVGADLAKALAEVVALQISQGRRDFESAQQDGQQLTWLVGVATVLALGIGALAAWQITRSITRPLASAVELAERVAQGDLRVAVEARGRDETARLLTALQAMVRSLVDVVGTVRAGSDSIATGSGQIATGNADLSQRTEEQAANLQQTAASMEQLSSTVKSNADTARQAAGLAAQARQVAEQGGEAVSRVVSTMGEISESSRRIADIIGVIDGIAFQTNILALNAAVEAARAGEQGRGFAVVASEVRSLAGRSAEAAREIKRLIGASVDQVAGGSQLVSEAGSTMDSIVVQVRKVSELLSEISDATGEQTAGIEQVSKAVSQLDEVTQQNAALVEESASAADSLSQQAQRLVQAVQVFKLSQAQ